MALSAYLAGKLKSVNYLLFSLSYFFQGESSFESHLQVKAHNLENLVVSRLESQVLFVSIDSAFTLHNDLDLLVLIADWER